MDDEKKDKLEHVIGIEVNEQPVAMHAKEATGLQIKQAAVDQSVAIQLDFVLSLELGERRSRVVGDDEVIHLHPHQKFIAVAPDDNS